MRRITHLLTTALVAVAGHGAQAQTQELGFTLDPILLGSAFRDDRALLDAPVAATVLDADALANRQAAEFEALIGDIPGLTIDGGPRGMAQEPNIRGFRDQQIVLRFDGGRFNYSQGHRGRFFVDPALIGRVEVVRGGGSTLFGSGALGGVISVETVDVADLILPGQTMGGRVNLGYSSNGERATANTTLFADYGGFDALLFLGTRQMGADVETGGGAPVPFSQLDSVNGMLKLGFEPSQDSRFELSFSRFLDDGLVPSNANGLAGPGNPVVDRAAQVDSFRLTWDYAPAGSDLIDLSVLFYAEWLGITETRVDTPRLDDTTYDTTGLEITNRSSLSLGVPVDLVYGIEILRDTQQGLRNGAPRPAFPDAEATTIAGFVEGTFAIGPQFDLIAGLRYDRYDRDPDDPALSSVTNEFLSPRLGLSYRPTEDWQVYANLSRAFRAPSLTELYNSGLHFPGNPFGFPPNNFFVPNPNLRPEASTQVEIGARLDRAGQWRDGDRLSFAASAYYADVTDYIDQTVSIAGGTTTFVNVDARLWGFEAEVDYDAIDWFVGAGLGIARGQGSDGFALGSLPQDRLTLTAGFRPTQDWELGARATLAADQDRLPAGGTPGPSYELLDLFATFAPDRGALAGSTIRIGLDNVFDESYTIYPNGLPQTGRSLQITASFTF